jgi:hypothetical protein
MIDALAALFAVYILLPVMLIAGMVKLLKWLD